MEWIYALPEIDLMARVFWEHFPEKKIFAFHGNMAAGKTTLISALCRIKKVKEPVSSPTFSIINEYSFPEGIIYHLDLYRLRDSAEALQAGVEDCLYSGEICLVEWPERAARIFLEYTLDIYLESLDSEKRKILVPSYIGKISG